MKLRDFVVTDFKGLVVNKSDFEMQKGELKNTLNLDLDEVGKLKRRRGIQQMGDTKSGTLDDSFLFTRQTLGSAPTTYHLIADRAGPDSTLYQMVSHYNTVAIATTDTEITMGATGALAASGTVEINGDLIAYTGIAGGQLTGVTGIRVAHPAFSLVNQIVSVGTMTAIDTRSGVYFAVINNVCFINGRVGSATFDGTNITAVSDADEASGLFATNYRDRIYLIGAGGVDGSGTRNGDPRRVSFSDAGDSTSWDINNFFDVEDDRGESGTGLLELNDTLLIFKTNSIFAYDEVQLKQLQWSIGAYNNKCLQKIENTAYTFCPNGVFATNGASAKKISQPIEKYLRHFRPQYDAITGRVVVNCFAGQYDHKYLLYLSGINEPEVMSDVVLIYDTVRGNWTVQNTYTSFRHFGSLYGFGQTTLASSARTHLTQQNQELFAGDTGGKYWRLFSNRFLDNESTITYRGTDLTANLVSNDAGNAISTVAETPFYHLGSLDWKKIGYITAFVEQGDFQISYRIDRGTEITDWLSLGNFTARQHTKRFRPNTQEGYRIALKVTSNTADVISTFNGFAIRDIETTERRPVIA